MTPAALLVRQTNGILSRGDKIRLVIPVLGLWRDHVFDMLASREDGRSSSEPVRIREPETEWARLAMRASALQSAEFRGHSLRTWLFAMLLSAADGAPLDEEVMYVAALLHDIGLFPPSPGGCFTISGADTAAATAKMAGVERRRAEEAADAILEHVSVSRPTTAAGVYLQAGSLLDITGHRRRQLSPSSVSAVCNMWPRTGFPAELRRVWLAECHATPSGRAAYVRCPGGLLLASRLARFPA